MFYSDPSQYFYDDSMQFISIEKIFASSFPKNPPAHNEFQAVKLFRPSQTELVKSEGGEAEAGIVGNIINIETNILRPEACLDGEDNPTLFINTGLESELSTFTQIPNNQVLELEEELSDIGSVTVNMFNNFDDSSNKPGIYYPLAGSSKSYHTNTLWLLNAWIQTNAHILNVRFINPPTGNMIINKANEKLGNINIFACLSDPSNGAELLFQFALSNKFLNKWIFSSNNANSIYSAITQYESIENIWNDGIDEELSLIHI